MTSRRLTISAGVSLILHAMVLASPAWHFADDVPVAGTPLVARLIEATPVGQKSSAPRAKRAPRRRIAPRPAPVIAGAPVASLGPAATAKPEDDPVSTPETSAPLPDLAQSTPAQSEPAQSGLVQSEPVEESAPQSTADIAQSVPSAAVSTPGQDAWAQSGYVRYEASYYGLPVVGELRWQQDGNEFENSLRGEMPLRGELLNQKSRGHIYQGIPISESFSEIFNRNSYSSVFDTANNRIVQQRKGEARDVPAAGKALDMLALMHFMATQPLGADPFEIYVVTFRGAVTRVVVQQLPPRSVELPLGVVQARPFHAEAHDGKLKIDIWLATEDNWKNAPVRIRVEDGKDVYDLKASRVDTDGSIRQRTE